VKRAIVALALFVACSSSSSEETAPAPQGRGNFQSGVVARVGGEDVLAATVARIARAQRVSLQEARDRAVYDTLFAAGAREALEPAEVESAARTVLARALLKELWSEKRQPPIAAEELARATAQRWTEFDRPAGFRVVHAVVRTPPNMPPEAMQRARKIAERIREAVSKVAETAGEKPAPEMDAERMFVFDKRDADPAAEAFIKAARSVQTPGIEVIAEELPPIAADARVIEIGAPPEYRPLDESFCKGATGLTPKRGALSDIVTSPYGFHVIMLLTTTPEKRLSEAERLEVLRDDILRMRGRRAQRELLEKLRGERPVEVESNAVSLMSEVRLRKEAKPEGAGAP
jgi:peptidyl-prolyl cis-trans isomerase C